MQEKGTSLPRNNRTIIRGIIVAVSLSALATSLIFYYTNADINQAFSSVNFWYLAAAVALILLNYALEAEKLCAITDAIGRELSFRRALQIALAGSFFANITPFDTGGEPFQIYLLARYGIAAGKSVAVIMVKGIISAITRLALGIVIPVWLILMTKSLVFATRTEYLSQRGHPLISDRNFPDGSIHSETTALLEVRPMAFHQASAGTFLETRKIEYGGRPDSPRSAGVPGFDPRDR